MAYQKLITKAIKTTKQTLYSTEGMAKDQIKVIAKFFTPWTSCTWYMTEYNAETGEAFGLCDLGQGFPELGYFNTNELASVRGSWGLKIERDMYWEGTLADAMKEHNMAVA